VIVVVGENHTFDNVFGGYDPKGSQQVWNLLSKHIINPDGTPGLNFGQAAQQQALDTGAYHVTPAKTGPLAQIDRPYTTYAFGQPLNVPDSRFPAALPNGPFQITKYVPYFGGYTGDPVHRFFQMWQQYDAGQLDLFPWVAETVGIGPQNGAPAPSPANTFEGGNSMGFLNMSTGDAPYLKFMADNYAISDNYHQGIMGGTGANFIYLGVFPGVGILLAAGPIASALAGLGAGAVGGIVGALVAMSIPEYEAKRYERTVQGGGVLLSLHCGTSEEIALAKEILRDSGATGCLIGRRGGIPTGHDLSACVISLSERRWTTWKHPKRSRYALQASELLRPALAGALPAEIAHSPARPENGEYTTGRSTRWCRRHITKRCHHRRRFTRKSSRLIRRHTSSVTVIPKQSGQLPSGLKELRSSRHFSTRICATSTRSNSPLSTT
jgi:phosphoesterase family protein